MEKHQLSDLFNRYLENRLSEAELREMIASFNTPDQEILGELISNELNSVDMEEANVRLSSISQEVYARLKEQINDSRFVAEPSKKLSLWPRIAVVAAAIATIVLGGWFFLMRLDAANETRLTQSALNDIAPGKIGATLTLASGKRIRLSDAANAEIAEEAGIRISKTSDGELVYEIKEISQQRDQINSLSTGMGETYRLHLPDGSSVWLNAASSLTYTVGLLKSGKRSVKLEGEAFFDVSKDKLRPFVVQSRGQSIEVLGTQFNINSYADELTVATTLVEGMVKVNSGIGEVILKPGEQALNREGRVHIEQVNVSSFVDWKDGDFNLDGLNFKVAMRKIARWYNVDVVFDESVPENLRSGGWISRDKKLSEVLRFIESSGIAKFRVEGRTIYVSR